MPKKLYRFVPDSYKEDKIIENERKSTKLSSRKQSPSPNLAPTPALSSSKRHYFQQYSHVGNVINYLEQHVAASGYQLTSPPKVCDPSEKQMFDYHQTIASDSAQTETFADNNEDSEKQKRSSSRPYSAPRRLLVKYKNKHSLKQDNIIPSVEIKDIITMQYFPEYISLRESYLVQLKQIVTAIMDSELENEKQALTTRLLLLIQALRQLSVKMLRVYKQTIDNDRVSEYELWDDFVDCLKSIPSTFDFIDSVPFRNYTGLYLTCNPFASLYDLLGEFAVNSSMLSHEALLRISHKPKYDEIVTRILPKALRFSDEEFDSHQEATTILKELCSQATERTTNTGSGDAARQSALTFLLFQPNSMAALEERGAVVDKITQRNNLQRSFAQWRMRYLIFEAVHSYAEQRKVLRLKRHFALFVQSYHQRIGMKALVQNARKLELSKGIRQWKAVYYWWKDYYDIFVFNRRYRLARYYLLEWKRLVKTGDIDLIAVEEENIAFALDYQKPSVAETVQTYVSTSTKAIARSKYWQGSSSLRPPWPFSDPNAHRASSPFDTKTLSKMVDAFTRAMLSHHFEQWLAVTHATSVPPAAIPSFSDETHSTDSAKQKIVRQYSAKLHPSAPAPLDKKPSSKLLTSLSFRSTRSFRSIADDEFENSMLDASNGSDNASYSYML